MRTIPPADDGLEAEITEAIDGMSEKNRVKLQKWAAKHGVSEAAAAVYLATRELARRAIAFESEWEKP